MTDEEARRSLAIIRKELYDPDSFRRMIPDIVQSTVKRFSEDMEWSDPLRELLEHALNLYLSDACEMIAEFCESPIEKLFLNTLTLLAIERGIGFVKLVPPCDDIEEQIAYYAEWRDAIDSLKGYGIFGEGIKLPDSEQMMRDAGVAEEEILKTISHYILYEVFGLRKGYHLTIQAGLPEHIKVNGRRVRVDILAWNGDDTSKRFVIECDGFRFHKSKEAFTQDRQRDRVLGQHGYKVIRFSGPEIHDNPIIVASELLDYIQELRGD